MLSDKQINEIQLKHTLKFKKEYPSVLGVGDFIFEAIKEALELNEKNKWKYPEKGELPEEGKDISFLLKDHIYCFGEKRGNWFFDVTRGDHVNVEEVKAWTYVPTMESE